MQNFNIFFSENGILHVSENEEHQSKSSGRIIDKLAADGFKMVPKRRHPTKKKRKRK